MLSDVKDLQKSLEHTNISVDESTIHKTLNKNDGHGRTPWKKPLLSKRKHCKFSKALLAKYYVDR